MNLWKDRLAKISITLTVIGFLASFAVSLRSYGINEGLAIGEQELREFKKEIGQGSEIRFSGGVIDTYESLATEYGLIASLFAIATVGFLMISNYADSGVRNIGFLVATVPQLLIIFKLQNLIRLKAFDEPSFWESPRNAFAYQTIVFDWLFLAVTALTSIGIVLLLIFRYRAR